MDDFLTDNTKTEETELVWLPKSLAKKIASVKNSDNFVLEYIEDSKREIKNDLDAFEDEIISYKAAMIKFREEFKKAKQEQIEANYVVWDKFEEDRKSIRDLATKAATELRPLTEELEKINSELSKISKYQMKDFVNTIREISGMLYGENRNILEFLVANYKKSEEK